LPPLQSAFRSGAKQADENLQYLKMLKQEQLWDNHSKRVAIWCRNNDVL